MAIVNVINTKAKSKAALKKIINYVTKAEKTDEKLISGKDLLPECALSEMMLTKKQFNKTEGRQYIHMIQSFSPKENISYEKAHEVGLELAEHFENFQVLVATHKDCAHVHSHFIINSVNFDNGLKFQQSFKQLQDVMDKSDEICNRNGLSVPKEREFGKHKGRNEHQVAIKGESWKSKLITTIDFAMGRTSTKDDFIACMSDMGYGVNWSDTRKYITYQTPEGKKCRCNKLHDKKYTKEEMENEYGIRKDEQSRWGGGYKASGNDSTARRLERDDEYAESRGYTESEGIESDDRNATSENQQFDYRESKGYFGYGVAEFSDEFTENSGTATSNENEFDECGGGNGESNESFFSFEYDVENTGWNASDIADIGNNLLLSLKVDEDKEDKPKRKTRKYTGDLSKSAKKEKALKEKGSMWDAER